MAVQGFALPDDRKPLTEEELAWLTFLRDLHDGPVRSPTLAAVQALRRALTEKEKFQKGEIPLRSVGS